MLRDRTFALFWAAHTVSEAGSRITYVVAPILVYRLTGSALNTGFLAALEAMPYLLFGLLAGALTDRVDRRRVMVGCSVLQAALLAGIPIASATHALGIVQVYVVAVLSASLFVWFDAANFGALPLVAGRDRLVEANSAIWAASSVIAVARPRCRRPPRGDDRARERDRTRRRELRACGAGARLRAQAAVEQAS